MEELLSLVVDLRIWVGIVLGLIVSKLVNNTPRLVRGYLRKRRLDYLKKIRKVRVNPLEVQYELAKAQSYFILFLLTCFMYLTFLIQGPMDKAAEQSLILFLILAIPLYIVEIVWLLQDRYARALIKVSRCLHIVRKSNSQQ